MSTSRRSRGRPWPRGTSGNPSGRPRGSVNQATRCLREALAPLRPLAIQQVQRILEVGLALNAPMAVIRAAELVLFARGGRRRPESESARSGPEAGESMGPTPGPGPA